MKLMKNTKGLGPVSCIAYAVADAMNAYARKNGLLGCMILDAFLRLDDDEALTVTRDSENIINMGVDQDLGEGGADLAQPLNVLVQVGTAFTAGGAATLDISLQGSPDNVTYTEYACVKAISVDDMTAGAQIFRMPLPPKNPDSAANPQYYKLVYTVSTGPFTAGTLNAWLAPTLQGNKGGYPRNFSVSN